MRWREAAIALLAALPSFALADVPIEYQSRIEPRFPGVAAVGPFAVAAFVGNDGKDFAIALRSELQTAEVDGHVFFALRNFDESVKVDTAAGAVKAGKAIAAGAVFFGTASTTTMAQSNYKQDQAHCTESGFLHCSKTETVQVPCTKYTGVYTVTPALYVVADARVFYTETVIVQASFSTCAVTQAPSSLDKILSAIALPKKDTPVAIASPEQLLAKLRADAAAEVRAHLTPTLKTIKVVFKDEAHDLAKADQLKFRNAAQFARANRLDRACGMFESLMTPQTAGNVALLYNLGVCQEALEPDRPAAALEYYAKADQQTSTPDRLVSSAFLRAKAQVDALRNTR